MQLPLENLLIADLCFIISLKDYTFRAAKFIHIETSIHSFLKAAQGKKVLVIGDLMLDRYLWGKVNRISPEAPVPIADIYEEESRLGGAANVALNLHAMGAIPILAGYVGEDERGAELIRLVHRHGFPTELIQLSNERRTTVKVRIIGNQQQILRVDKEDKFDLSETELDRIKQKLDNQIAKCDVILLQDYDKGLLVPKLISRVLAKAKELSVPVTVDPKFKHFFSFEHSSLFKPNLKELNQGLNLRLRGDDLEGIQAAVEQLREQMPHQHSLITLGSHGMFLMEASGESRHFAAHERSIADVSGAGDTVISVVSLGLACGLPLSDAVYFANLAGGLVCEEVGVVFIDPQRLIEASEKDQA
ncbi:MAG: bifunctional ADP-heptose synthase [Bacteroidota bacterium]